MSVKNLIGIIFFSLIITNIQAQIRNLGDNQTAELIMKSDKDYKLIYIFCNYCQTSSFPKVVEMTQGCDNVEAFFICAQDSFEVAEYMDTCSVKTSMYLINQNRKRRLISFYNPIKATCKFMEKYFNMDTSKMGASGFCILNKDNQVIKQTNWEMKDEECFLLLKNTLF